MRSDRLLLQAVKAIRNQERAMRNIRIRAKTTIYNATFGPKRSNQVWTNHPHPLNHPANVVKLAATYDGLPWGKCRADVPIFQIRASGRPVYAMSYSAAYNGSVGTYLQWSAGTSKKQVSLFEGDIGGKMPSAMSGANDCSGWMDSIYGFTSDMHFDYHPKFSAYIRPGQKGVALDARWASWNGKKYLRVTRIGDPLGKEVFMLDPRKRFAIAGYDCYGWQAKKKPTGRIYLVPGTRVRNEFHVIGFLEPTPGIFYPSRIEGAAFSYDTAGKKKLFYTSVKVISKVTVNDPNVNNATYVVRFPRGAIVTDTATNKVIRIGGTRRQQLKEIEKAVEPTRKAVATKPAAKKP